MDSRFSWAIVLVFLTMAVLHLHPALTSVYHGVTGWVVCPFRWVTGVPCPGCGMTRAFWDLSAFNVAAAAHQHPFSFVLLGWCVLDLVGGPAMRKRLTRVAPAVLAALLTWWVVVRLLPLLD